MTITKKEIFRLSVFVCSFFIAFAFTPTKEFDLYRYYEFYDNINVNQPVTDFFSEVQQVNFDFIYYLTLFFAKTNNIDKTFINGWFFAFYYYVTLLIVDSHVTKAKNLPFRRSWQLLLIPLLVAPPIYTLSISRTVASLGFFILSIYLYSNGKRAFSLISFFGALMTHIGMAIYALPLSLIIIAGRNIIWGWGYKLLYVAIFFICLFSFYWLDGTLAFIGSLSFFDTFSRYSTYLGSSTAIFHDLAYYDYWVAAYLLTVGFLLFLSINIHNKYTLAAGYILLFFATSINYSTMLTQRTMMIFPAFLGILLFEASSQLRSSKARLLANGVLLASIFFISINILGYRVILYRSFFY